MKQWNIVGMDKDKIREFSENSLLFVVDKWNQTNDHIWVLPNAKNFWINYFIQPYFHILLFSFRKSNVNMDDDNNRINTGKIINNNFFFFFFDENDWNKHRTESSQSNSLFESEL